MVQCTKFPPLPLCVCQGSGLRLFFIWSQSNFHLEMMLLKSVSVRGKRIKEPGFSSQLCLSLCDLGLSFSLPVQAYCRMKGWIICKIFSRSESINAWPENSSYIRNLQPSKTWLPYYYAMPGPNELCLDSPKSLPLIEKETDRHSPSLLQQGTSSQHGGQCLVVMCFHCLQYSACQKESTALLMEGGQWKGCSCGHAWCH